MIDSIVQALSVLLLLCSLCEETNVVYADNILEFKYPGIGANVLAMALSGVVFFIITLLLEQSFFVHKLTSLFIGRTAATQAEIYDHDVSPL